MSNKIKWNWQHKNWPNFGYDASKIKELEDVFLKKSGMLLGVYTHINQDEKYDLLVDMLSDEAANTSEIEGEFLSRDSLQSSIRRNMGLQSDNRKVKPAEAGIAEMMISLYQNYKEPLSHNVLFYWHKMLMKGRSDCDIGEYRQHSEPMQIISGRIDEPKIHFEAPPSSAVKAEMDRFIAWYNNSKEAPLTKAAIAHLYFESIHPFEDGNGRIGRAIVEKAIAQAIEQPSLLALSKTILANKKKYYDMLERNNKSLQIDEWLEYFANIILAAQENSIKTIEFLIKKAKFYDKFRNHLNLRQEKAITRIFREGLCGFKGGLSAENYITITKTSRATATRDLNDLVHKQVFVKAGGGKGTRYSLNLLNL